MNFVTFHQLLGKTGSLHGWTFQGYKGYTYNNRVPADREMKIVAHGVDELGQVHLFLEAEGVPTVYITNDLKHFSQRRRGNRMDPQMRHVHHWFFTSPTGEKAMAYCVGVVEPVSVYPEDD